MKKFIYLMAMVCTLGFTACSSDDDPEPAKRLEAIEGTWNVEEYGLDPTTYLPTGSVKVNWEGNEKEAVFNNFMGAEEPYKVSDALTMVCMLGNAKLPNVLKSVTFTADGKITALYKDAASTTAVAAESDWKVAEGYATYTVENDSLISVSLNTSKVTESIKDAQQKSMIEGILNQYKQIPVHISWDATKTKPYFYVDKEFVQPLIANLVAVISNVPTTGMDEKELEKFNAIKNIVVQLPTIMEATTKLEMGIELTK